MAYEDLTTFIEVDPNNLWSQTPTRNTGIGVGVTEDGSYIYKDYGEDYFTDFIHKLDIKILAQTGIGADVYLWALNKDATFAGYGSNSIALEHLQNSLTLRRNSTAYGDAHDSASVSLNTSYYLLLQGIDGSISCKIYTTQTDRDGDTGNNLLDTISIWTDTKKFRYLHCGGASDWAGTTDCYSENFDFGFVEEDTGISPINLGSSTVEYATAFSSQRKIVKTSTGKLVLWAIVDENLKYKTSDDNGDTWSSWIDTGHNDIESCDVKISSNNDMYLIYKADYNSNISFEEYIYNDISETWSVGNSDFISSARAQPHIIKDSGGKFWVICFSGDDLYLYSSVDGGDNFSVEDNIDVGYAIYDNTLIQHGDNIWVFARIYNILGDRKLVVYEFDTIASSFDSGTEIGEDIGLNNGLSVVKNSDDDIWVASSTTSGIKIWHWNGSVWDSGTALSDNTNDQDVSICLVAGNLFVVWKDWNGFQYDIVYRQYKDETWQPVINITKDGDRDYYPTTLMSDAGSFYLAWTKWSSSYDILFVGIQIVVPVELEDTLNLSDAIELNLSREKIELIDTLNLSDSIGLNVSREKVELEDTLNLSDDLTFTKTKILGDTLNLSDEIYLNLSKESVNLNDTLTLSDNVEVLTVTREIIDINNKFRTVIGVVKDIPNKFNTAIRVIKDLGNVIGTAYGKILDFANDIRTLKLSKYNISNDFRMLTHWIAPGDPGFQSFGKTYIKVYIGSVEQTDIKIDSITITKIINGSHTATFDLARPYDDTKPSINSSVIIKYRDWTLFKGYVTDITPTNSPESIRILCNDKYWQENKTNKYFFVGHEPKDNTEKYYERISEGLSACGCGFGIGGFIPQTINCFGQGESECITSLVTNSGNFAWYYDKNENKQLWRAGSGSIINLERQELGKNLGLHQILRHQFKESIINIINKFKVQMGEKIIKRFNRYGGSKEYSGYYYSWDIIYPSPMWDTDSEKIAKDSFDGYGFDYHKPEDDDKYANVFKKYRFWRFRNYEREDWTDRYPPQITISMPWWGTWEAVPPFPKPEPWDLFPSRSNTIREGFTIDYDEGTITFNTPHYFIRRDSKGEEAERRRANIRLSLYKKKYWSRTEDPSDNPEEDIASPLMFFTYKMGDYSETIIDSLELSGLSIQEGGLHITGQEAYEALEWSSEQYKYITVTKYRDIWTNIPSWNDTEFAKDYANWQLSKICDKKVKGSIDVTLDTICFYNIKLKNRIMIDGIIENPLNIVSISYNIGSFTATINLERHRDYSRNVSIQSRGEGE